MSSANRSFAVGSYDAQKGEDVVTFREQFPAARLIPVRRALMWSPLLLVLAGCGATAHRRRAHFRRSTRPSAAPVLCVRGAPTSRSPPPYARPRGPTAGRERSPSPALAA